MLHGTPRLFWDTTRTRTHSVPHTRADTKTHTCAQVREKFSQFTGHEVICVEWALRRWGYQGEDNAVLYMLKRQEEFQELDWETLSNRLVRASVMVIMSPSFLIFVRSKCMRSCSLPPPFHTHTFIRTLPYSPETQNS